MVRVSKDLQHKPSDEASEALKHKDQTLDPEKSIHCSEAGANWKERGGHPFANQGL